MAGRVSGFEVGEVGGGAKMRWYLREIKVTDF